MTICPSCGEENPKRFRLCGFCGAELAPGAPPQEVRKTVTIVFSDLKGSTSLGEKLDSESLRELMTRYFEGMRVVLERHGGTVEKFIGDAIMAVFGLPKVHEDDALRAVRAAAEMQRTLVELNEELERDWGASLATRTGVNTGEVVAGDPRAGQRLVLGDAVNVAARLEQAAGEMEILLGALTYRLVRDAVEVEAVEPLDLKGKSKPVPAYRLVTVKPERAREGAIVPLIGRESELALLARELGRAVDERSCRLVTLLGDPGVGKSSLVAEFSGAIAAEAEVLRGRCLAYGRGITFWPLAEAVRQAAGIVDADTPGTAREKLSTIVGGDAAIVERVASAFGLSEQQFLVDEVFWAVRMLLESLARRRPLVVVFDDIHWAEPTFLELIEHLVDTARDAPLLVLCPARPVLLELRPSWAQRPKEVRLVLTPLSEADVVLVLENLVGSSEIADDARRRIVDAAEGNPLFAEQLLSMMVDDGLLRYEDGRWVAVGDLSNLSVPPTIQALLAARLDQLEREERLVLEAASVVGQRFALDAVQELVPDLAAEEVATHVAALVRKQLLRPQDEAADGERGFRFHHILVRDAAYLGILKRARATLHERFVVWADRVNRLRDRESEYEEILGYHLEQAHRYLTELGPLDDHGRSLGTRAAERLSAPGRRAFARGDMPAAANLLRRAATLLPPQDRGRLELLPSLGEALGEIGEFAWAEVFLDEAVEGAGATGEPTLLAKAELVRLLVGSHSKDGWSQDEVVRRADLSIPVFAGAGDDAGLAQAYRLLAWARGTACRYGDAAAAAQRAVEHARIAGDERQRTHAASQYAVAALYGPTPVLEAIERCGEIVEQVSDDRRSRGLVLGLLGCLEAMRGDFERARDLCSRGRATLQDLGRNVVAASTSQDSCTVEMLAGDPAAAERDLRRDFEALTEMGEAYLLSTIAGELARAVYDQGRTEEADELSRVAERYSAADDVTSQALWRSVRAKVLARRGDADAALPLAREAVALLRTTDALVRQADALVDQAEVLRLLDEGDAARACLEEAIELFERKGNVVAAGKARSAVRLSAVRAAPAGA
ncbi:MAG TPA: adenylate/guanylate cyclase domain-containing protein [Gaiellaceae bacterium]|nr:adenylate/guanylate cyclase domain-containing protein [Gaiellaceae bacterium]